MVRTWHLLLRMIQRSIAMTNIVLPDGTAFTCLWQPAQLLKDWTFLHKTARRVSAGRKVDGRWIGLGFWVLGFGRVVYDPFSAAGRIGPAFTPGNRSERNASGEPKTMSETGGIRARNNPHIASPDHRVIVPLPRSAPSTSPHDCVPSTRSRNSSRSITWPLRRRAAESKSRATYLSS
jgi:hypothetical protein